MKFPLNSIVVSALLFCSTGFAAVNDKALLEELTGKKSATVQKSKKSPLSVRHYQAGKAAAAQKNYILAIKHFNTVIKNYPKSVEVKSALVAKAQIYKEMGLQDQANRNLKMAQTKNVKPQQAANTQGKAKLNK